MTSDDPGIRDLEPDTRDLVATLFPVEVALPDGSVVQRGKVFVLVGGVVVFGERDGKPLRLFAARHAEPAVLANPVAPKRRQRSTFVTVSGTVYANGILGCGCGSVLKNLTHTEALT